MVRHRRPRAGWRSVVSFLSGRMAVRGGEVRPAGPSTVFARMVGPGSPALSSAAGPRTAKIALAGTVVSCLAMAALADTPSPTPAGDEQVGVRALADRSLADAERASRSGGRSAPSTRGNAAPVLDPVAAELAARRAAAAQRVAAEKAAAKKAADQKAAQAAAAKKAAEKKAAEKKAAAAKAAVPKPVAGLSQKQMNNAATIVATGRKLGVPRRALIAAIACAMQESTLRNLASNVIPESFNYRHEGSGSDHDSVGLFQQRPSAGWGTVKNLMTPSYAATKFYQALMRVPGWQNMALTYAIQAVQVSAFPEAYAKHEPMARTVVNALT